MLTDYKREVAITLVKALCEYGLTENLAQYGEHCAGFGFMALGEALRR